MPSWINIARWIHILAFAAWLGEICLMAFVFMPQVSKMPLETRKLFMTRIFPSISRLASHLIAATMLSGLWLNYLMTGWRNMGAYLSSRHGLLVLAGGGLGMIITLVHFGVLGQFEARFAGGDQDPAILRRMQLVPRIGLVVISLAFILMMVAARGW
ncbi:MAG: hypothetical protein KIS85_00520 [Anaerolineales bacterium]|nr:hypothetical protein [Anaerolineales bacterium]